MDSGRLGRNFVPFVYINFSFDFLFGRRNEEGGIYKQDVFHFLFQCRKVCIVSSSKDYFCWLLLATFYIYAPWLYLFFFFVVFAFSYNNITIIMMMMIVRAPTCNDKLFHENVFTPSQTLLESGFFLFLTSRKHLNRKRD